jgi:hypothetical protein
LCFACTGHHRAPLQTVALAGFDFVFARFEHAAEAAMDMWHMIAAVEVIIDKHLPIAGQLIRTAFKPPELVCVQVIKPLKEIAAQKFFQFWAA